jgi:hypothetical protein
LKGKEVLMTKLFFITVEGSGMFPLDMLRYDGVWPRTSDDVEKISAHVGADYFDAPEDSVNLLSTKLPTPARWESFGWQVLKTTKV